MQVYTVVPKNSCLMLDHPSADRAPYRIIYALRRGSVNALCSVRQVFFGKTIRQRLHLPRTGAPHLLRSVAQRSGCHVLPHLQRVDVPAHQSAGGAFMIHIPCTIGVDGKAFFADSGSYAVIVNHGISSIFSKLS
ncbi:hypothetical protein Y032_0990g3306 [Ancylostoma ceylanicum]|uniref:Uncharacterized protein n=1 Tax=Ancylostoma ceylanicum TaxID=53326 RepID=A0A016W9P7_9BILA|nr:hypothetical protein Y032_0990g3306 [Ancylostoma ceylanicum]